MVKVFIGVKSAKMGMKKSFLPPLTKRTRADKIINVRERETMASYSVDVNLWLQDAIEFHINEYVKEFIKNRDNLKEDVVVQIKEIYHSFGFIEVSWSYMINIYAPTTYHKGTESFSLAEVLKICMTEKKV